MGRWCESYHPTRTLPPRRTTHTRGVKGPQLAHTLCVPASKWSCRQIQHTCGPNAVHLRAGCLAAPRLVHFSYTTSPVSKQNLWWSSRRETLRPKFFVNHGLRWSSPCQSPLVRGRSPSRLHLLAPRHRHRDYFTAVHVLHS